jgi:uncharacterized membrane protein
MARRGIGITLAALVASLALASPAQARSADIVAANVDLMLAHDASLMVSEHLTFDYHGTFHGSYRDIPLLHGERVTDVRVSTGGVAYRPGGNTALGSQDQPGVFGATRIPDGERIVWHYSARNEQRTYDISYRVVDGAVAYSDVIDVGWTVWGDQWKFDLPSLTAQLRNPALDPRDRAYRVWGHPRDVEGKTTRGRGVATLQASNVFAGQAVEMRVTVPRRPGQDVSGARPGAGKGLPKILAEERALDAEFNSTWNRFKRFVASHAELLALLIGLVLLGALGVMLWLTREHPTSTAEYVPEPPEDATPALAYGLAHEGEGSSNTVLATLLDLVERGYYYTKQATTRAEKLDLGIWKASPRQAGTLEPYEQQTLDFFDELVGEYTVPLSEMKDRVPEHSEEWRTRWTELTSALNAAAEGQLAWDRDLNSAKLAAAIVAGIAVAGIALIQINVEHHWFLAALIGAAPIVLVVYLPARKLKRLASANRERAAKWEAFERWTHDFPRLEDDPPATLQLWKRILIYGVAFGTADRMIKSGRIPEPVASSATGTWSGYWLAGSYGNMGFNAGSFGSGFASHVAPASGGGGGFSGGGGGGFSGGGGGGSW